MGVGRNQSAQHVPLVHAVTPMPTLCPAGRVYQDLARVEVAEIRKISTICKILAGKITTDIGLDPVGCVCRMGLALGT